MTVEEDRERYERAAHAMQTGVAAEMGYDPRATEPKHLRVGVNSALVDSGALAGLLIRDAVLKTWRARRRCFHHNNHTGESWIGRGSIVYWRKWYQCSRCGKGWLI